MRQGYTRIPNALISDGTLSLAARMVYVYIASQDKGWVFRPEVMERELGIGRDKRRELIRELEKRGLIEIQRNGVDGGCSYTYKPIDVISGARVEPKDGNSGDDHLINNKNRERDKNRAQAREALSQYSSPDLDGLKDVFVAGTKQAAEKLGCPRAMTMEFHRYWTAITDTGWPLWKTKEAFNFEQRLRNWMKNER